MILNIIYIYQNLIYILKTNRAKSMTIRELPIHFIFMTQLWTASPMTLKFDSNLVKIIIIINDYFIF